MDSASTKDQATSADSSGRTRSSPSSDALVKLLLVRRERWSLTWTGRLLALGLAAALVLIAGRNLGSFLSVSSPVGGQFLVVEGWMPVYAYREAAAQFRRGGYQKAIAATTLQYDGDLSDDLQEHSGAEKLIRFGLPADMVVMVSSPQIHKDRTFHAAMTVKDWLQHEGLTSASIDVVTVGAHARRSRLLYEKAFGDAVKVGVISIPDRRFDPDHWWRSSEGVRSVVDEFVAYLYVRTVFLAPD